MTNDFFALGELELGILVVGFLLDDVLEISERSARVKDSSVGNCSSVVCLVGSLVMSREHNDKALL